ncbi:MAG: hypothetical protein F4Y86_15035 [Gammaproteobacteria bacterium]|nr:hypothetical protein [Gammaproteobacteria bacterium]MYB37206.1 hypothetical protein [Gammaproteobacteria bacterium]
MSVERLEVSISGRVVVAGVREWIGRWLERRRAEDEFGMLVHESKDVVEAVCGGGRVLATPGNVNVEVRGRDWLWLQRLAVECLRCCTDSVRDVGGVRVTAEVGNGLEPDMIRDVLARLGETTGWTTDEALGGCCRFELVPRDEVGEEVGGVASVRVSRVDDDGKPLLVLVASRTFATTGLEVEGRQAAMDVLTRSAHEVVSEARAMAADLGGHG